MFYRQHKTFWYQFCNLKYFLKAENSEDIFASSCEQNSVTCHVTQSETELLLELATCIDTKLLLLLYGNSYHELSRTDRLYFAKLACARVNETFYI